MMTHEDPVWLRREGRRLIAKGQAMIDMATNLEADQALDADSRVVGPVGRISGLADVAREMALEGPITAQALAERAGVPIRNAASRLSKLAGEGELSVRRMAGYPAEYYLEVGNGRAGD